MPVAIFALCAFFPGAASARAKHMPLLAAGSTLLVLHFLVVSRVNLWWGGFCWGPRYLTEIMPVLVILTAVGSAELERPWIKRLFVAAAVYSVLIQAVGVYFYPNGHWDNTPVPVDRAGYRVWDWRDNPIRRTVIAGPLWQPYVIVAAAVTNGLPAASEKMRELGVHLY